MSEKPNWLMFLLIAGAAYLIFKKPKPAAAAAPAPTTFVPVTPPPVQAPLTNVSAATQTLYSGIVNSTPAAQAITTQNQADPWQNNPLMQFEIQ